MKKLIGLMAMAIFLFSVFVFSIADAKPYKALSGDLKVEIPDDAVLPSYLSRLQKVDNILDSTADQHFLVLSRWADPDFQYFTEEGEEFYPYTEYIKWEKDVVLIGILFVTDDGELVGYYDREGFIGPATGKWTKTTISDAPKSFKKVPRQKN